MLQFSVLVKYGVGKLENYPGKSGWLFSYCNIIIYCNIIWGQTSPDVRNQAIICKHVEKYGVSDRKESSTVKTGSLCLLIITSGYFRL